MMVIEEMRKLREGLDAAGIKWHDKSEYRFGMEFQRTHFTNRQGVDCSVIYAPNISYGWQGEMLECMPPIDYDPNDEDFADEVQGWLSADEILFAWA